MTPESYALGLRARSAKGFRWMGGMAASAPGWLDDARIVEVEEVPYLWEYRWYLRGRPTRDEWDADLVPVLDDDATLGCLRALVRKAWRSPQAHTRPGRARTWSFRAGSQVMQGYRSEAEALVAALEAAP